MRKSKGFGLIDMLIGIGIALVALVVFMVFRNHENQRDLAVHDGRHIALLRDAARGYVRQNFTTLANSGTTALSIATLQNASHLNVAYAPTNSWGSTYTIALTHSGSATARRINVSIYTNTPKTLPSNVSDDSYLGTAVLSAGDDVGYAGQRNPALVSGANGNYTFTNPTGQPGILGAFFTVLEEQARDARTALPPI